MEIKSVECSKYSLTELSVLLFELLEATYVQSPWSEKYLMTDLEATTSHYLLAFERGRLIGMLAFSRLMVELEITNLAVHPEFQGQGIATKLLTELSAFPGQLFLEVRASNHAARRCYEKFGFKIYHTRKNYYDKPLEDALLMRKEQF